MELKADSRFSGICRRLAMALIAVAATSTPLHAQTIQWVRQFGSSSLDTGYGVAVDSTGIYVAGETWGTFPGQTSSSLDAFIRKYDLAGNVLWTRQFGTSKVEVARAVAVDSTGVYVGGTTPGTLPGQTHAAGGSDAFVRKYDSNGNELWTREFGVVFGGSSVRALSADSTGFYVAGTVCCAALAGQTSVFGLNDAFVRRYDAAGNAVWTRQFGTAGSDGVSGIASDTDGVYIAGTAGCGLSGSTRVCPALPGQSSSGGEDAFVKKYDTNGTALWTNQFGSTQFGATTDDSALGVAVSGGRVYVGAATFSASAGHFVRLYDAAGRIIWTTQFGALGPGVYIQEIAADADGVYITGDTSGVLSGQTAAGSRDAILEKLTADAAPPCTYSVSPAIQNFTAGSGTGSLTVTAPGGCPWTAGRGLASFVTFTAGDNGSGTGTLAYSVSANTAVTGRTAFLTVAGQTVSIVQAGASTSPPTTSPVTTLNFPRILSAADLQSTGFALLNPSATDAAVTVTLYSALGQVAGSSSQMVPARGQLAKLGADLFRSASTPGWVQVTSASTGLQSFWIGGDFSGFADGAEAAVPAADQEFRLTTSGTEINIANPGASQITVTFYLYAGDGRVLTGSGSTSRSVRGMGAIQEKLGDMFPAASLATATHLRAITSSGQFAATSVASGYIVTPSWAVLNAVETTPSSPLLELNFPHVASGPVDTANYTTLVGVTNLNTTSLTVSLTFTPESGPAITVTRTLVSNGSLREYAASLFGFTSGFQTGWLRVTGTAGITGFVLYAESTAGGIAVVPVQPKPSDGLLFAHIADLAPWYTGFALLNVTDTAANVEVFAVNPDGTLIGNAAFRVNAGTKAAKLLSEIIPQTQNRKTDGGFIFVRTTNAISIYGVELFFTRSGSVLANVPGSAVPPGIVYTPPLR